MVKDVVLFATSMFFKHCNSCETIDRNENTQEVFKEYRHPNLLCLKTYDIALILHVKIQV